MNEIGTYYLVPYKKEAPPEIKEILGVSIDNILLVNVAELDVLNDESPVGNLELTKYKEAELYHLKGNISGEKINEIFENIEEFFDYCDSLEKQELVLRDRIAHELAQIRNRIIPCEEREEPHHLLECNERYNPGTRLGSGWGNIDPPEKDKKIGW